MSKHYHFIGIGGIGVGALAVLSLKLGNKVTGSDIRPNQVTGDLKARGVEIYIGHDGKNVQGADCVIYSSAIGGDNAELQAAKDNHIPIMQRAKFLAKLMENHIGITVAGAHGKTTTASMIACVLQSAGFNPTTAVGGIVNQSESHARIGAGKYFITEVDESDGSFLYFSPHHSVITNIDFEHVDQYPRWSSIVDAYAKFINCTLKGGTVLAYGDDERLCRLLEASDVDVKTYGLHQKNDIYAQRIEFGSFDSQFDCVVDGKNLGSIKLNVPGRHNVVNALACVALSLNLSIAFEMIASGLREYHGVQRRFQLRGKADNIWVIDDYAHHPTEIKATLETALLLKLSRQSELGEGMMPRLFTVVQPHRYTRVQGLWKEFVASLNGSDQMIITDIYSAGEQPIKGITAGRLCDEIQKLKGQSVHYMPFDKIVSYLSEHVRPYDIVLTLGAGDITRIANELAQAFQNRTSDFIKAKI